VVTPQGARRAVPLPGTLRCASRCFCSGALWGRQPAAAGTFEFSFEFDSFRGARLNTKFKNKSKNKDGGRKAAATKAIALLCGAGEAGLGSAGYQQVAVLGGVFFQGAETEAGCAGFSGVHFDFAQREACFVV
jgi:hypothetical protein